MKFEINYIVDIILLIYNKMVKLDNILLHNADLINKSDLMDLVNKRNTSSSNSRNNIDISLILKNKNVMIFRTSIPENVMHNVLSNPNNGYIVYTKFARNGYTTYIIYSEDMKMIMADLNSKDPGGDRNYIQMKRSNDSYYIEGNVTEFDLVRLEKMKKSSNTLAILKTIGIALLVILVLALGVGGVYYIIKKK
jgi:hypothetical protein